MSTTEELFAKDEDERLGLSVSQSYWWKTQLLQRGFKFISRLVETPDGPRIDLRWRCGGEPEPWKTEESESR